MSESTTPFVEAVEPKSIALASIGQFRETVALPPGWSLQDLTPFIGKRPPQYREGTVVLHDIESLTDYLVRYSHADSVIYVDSVNQRITAVLDDGVAGSPGAERRVDLAVLSIALDSKFKLWVQWTSQPVSQKSLVRFIEENDSHFFRPSGAEMRTLAAALDVKKTTAFKSIEKMVGAARDVVLGYETSTSEQGEIKFPSEIVIKVPVFEHQQRAELPVRIYFDLVENSVQFTLRIPDVEAIKESAWEAVKKELAKALAVKNLSLPVLNGTAPKPPNS